jgi:hypothetical protein
MGAVFHGGFEVFKIDEWSHEWLVRLGFVGLPTVAIPKSTSSDWIRSHMGIL